MKQETVYDRIRNRTKPETRRYVQKNLAIVAEVSRLMKEKGWTQKELAKKMGKTESEVSKWLSGLHNLTLKSIAKMETVLEANLLEVPQAHTKQAAPIQYVTMVIHKPFERRWMEKSVKTETADFENPGTLSDTMAA